MTYAEADSKLQGRCKRSRKLQNNTYLERCGEGEIAVKLHSTRVLVFYRDGRVRVAMGGWNTMTTKDRINSYLPGGWRVWSHASKYGSGVALLGARWNADVAFDSHDVLTIMPDDTVKGGDDPVEIEKAHRAEVNARRRERYRERYWILRARRGGASKKPLTLDMIQQEQNVSVRMAMIKVYGLERFMVEVNARVVDTRGDYQLLQYPIGRSNIIALKMVCPSTKTVYIHPVEPGCETVDHALDWMFQTEHYSKRLLAEA